MPTKKKQPVTRKRKLSTYKSFRLSKRIKHPAGPIPGVRLLLRKTKSLLWTNKKALLTLVLLFLALNFAFVRGFASPLNVGEVKEQLQVYMGGDLSRFETTAAIFGQLINPSAEKPPSSGLIQGMLLVIFGLATAWVFRQSATGNHATAKAALYKGMYPLVPLLLVITVILLETIPAILGSGVYNATIGSGVAVTGYEKAIWILLSSSLVLLSMYMLFSSMFALYIVTLPDVAPIKALRSARQLVFSRRINILLKLLVVPLILVIILIVIVVPAIYFAAFIAPWLYYILTILGVLFIHAYLFTLYKELL